MIDVRVLLTVLIKLITVIVIMKYILIVLDGITCNEPPTKIIKSGQEGLCSRFNKGLLFMTVNVLVNGTSDYLYSVLGSRTTCSTTGAQGGTSNKSKWKEWQRPEPEPDPDSGG